MPITLRIGAAPPAQRASDDHPRPPGRRQLAATPPAPPRPPPPHILTRRQAALAAAAAVLSAARPAHASSPPQPSTSSIAAAYDAAAPSYDVLDGGAGVAGLFGFPGLRAGLLASGVSGRVLEVGIGTGLNLPLYPAYRGLGRGGNDPPPPPPTFPPPSRPPLPPPIMASLTGLDISGGMLAGAAGRAAALGVPLRSGDGGGGGGGGGGDGSDGGDGSSAARPPSPLPALTLVQGDVSALPFRPSSFDTVVSTFSLCVFPDPGAALREVRRVLAPGGRALLLEHTVSPNPLLGAYQRATSSVIANGGGGRGCRWDDDVRGLLEGAGFVLVQPPVEALGGVVTAFVVE